MEILYLVIKAVHHLVSDDASYKSPLADLILGDVEAMSHCQCKWFE